ncbi:cation transporter [bacterium]|nr:MAG: cation transporter [bacterium]
MEKTGEILKAVKITFFLNFLVSLLKIVVGLFTNLLSLISDGIHSLSDAFINIVGFFSLKMAGRPPDEIHPYGYEKYETIAVVIIGAFSAIMGFEVMKTGIERLMMHAEVYRSTLLGLYILGITVFINIITVFYEGGMGRKLKSDFLIADSRETRLDILTSIVIFIGIILIRMGVHYVDGILAIILSGIIFRNAYHIFKESAYILTDAAAIPPQEICKVVMKHPEVIFAHAVRSRGKEGAIYIQLHLGVDPNMTVKDAHDRVSHEVKQAIKEAFPGVRYVITHIEPATPEGIRRARKVFKEDKYHNDCGVKEGWEV